MLILPSGDRGDRRGCAAKPVTPDGKTAFVANAGSGTVSTIDVNTKKKNRHDIMVGAFPGGVVVTRVAGDGQPDGRFSTAIRARSRAPSAHIPPADACGQAHTYRHVCVRGRDRNEHWVR
jgi:YVTN family beta-propeller protein